MAAIKNALSTGRAIPVGRPMQTAQDNPPASEMSNAFTELANTVQYLDAQLAGLVNRLSPVLRPPFRDVGAAGETEGPAVALVTQQAMQLTQQLRSLTGVVEDLQERLAV